ncbi:unnamed protein product [Rotaria socialis]|uniref:Uncharacterized protein n=1 Tax=Rotaria socialis TaxID=392032 RepID=A0A819AYF8_9BILA|nr:unnamed protein product [Rotaria socialis]CAF4871644.1 unnamed protein product [Rotaria socialis]
MSAVPFGYQRENTIIASTRDVALAYNHTETTNIGNIRATGITVTVPKNYAGRYNFAVDNYNSLPVAEKKKMRGGRFLLRRYILIAFWLLSMIFGGISAVLKPLVVVPIVVSLLYMAISIYNIVIFKKNSSVLHPTLMLHNNDLRGNNEWYTVPIHTRIEDRAALAAVGGDDSAAMSAIREQYTNMKEIKIMVYTERYIRLFTYFPTNTIILHIFVFVVSFMFGVVLAAAVH